MNRWKELTFGQDISLGLEPHRLRTSIWWTASSVAISVDLVAFVLGQGRRVRSIDDMVFYNQPQTPDTSVVHEGKVCEGDRGIDELSLNLDLVGDDI